MPSVMMTTSGMPASTASMTAPLAKAGGTKTTDTSAPVASLASATVPYTGTETLPAWRSSAPRPMGVTSKSRLVPALRAVTPPTTVVPEPSMRRVCFWPSAPVMPWTMTRESAPRKIDLCVVRPLLRELGGLGRCVVHRVHPGHLWVRRPGEDVPALAVVFDLEPADDQ